MPLSKLMHSARTWRTGMRFHGRYRLQESARPVSRSYCLLRPPADIPELMMPGPSAAMAAAARRTPFAASECCSTARRRGQGCRSRAKWQLVESPPRSLHQILAMHSCFDLSNECNAAARKRTIRTPHSNDDLVRAAQPALFTRSQPWVPLREDRTSAIATSRVALPNGSACSCEQRGARQHAVGRTKGEVRRTERPPQPCALPLERLARNPPSEQTTPPWNQHVHTAPLLSSPAQEGIHDRRGAAPFQAGEA